MQCINITMFEHKSARWFWKHDIAGPKWGLAIYIHDINDWQLENLPSNFDWHNNFERVGGRWVGAT